MKPGRNDPCHCGSGQKYKKCHSAADDAAHSAELKAQAAAREAAAVAAEAEAAAAAAEGDGNAPAAESSAVNTAPRARSAGPNRSKATGGHSPPMFRRKAV